MAVRAHKSSTIAARFRQLALVGATLVGLLGSGGCAIGPRNWLTPRHAIDGLMCDHGSQCGCGRGHHGPRCHECGDTCGCSEDDSVHCGDACEDAGWEPKRAEEEPLAPLTITIPRFRIPHRKWYEPEAGIFNFCVPPAVIAELPPPPPGRFFPVPARPVFAPQPASDPALQAAM